MNEKSLEKNLANMERELIALQTAHDIGLGSVIYWEYNEVSGTLVNNYSVSYIKVKVKDGEKEDLIIQFFADTSKVAQPTIYKSDVYQGRYLLYAINLDYQVITYFNWKLISTSQIEYSDATSEQEVIDWLGGDIPHE